MHRVVWTSLNIVGAGTGTTMGNGAGPHAIRC